MKTSCVAEAALDDKNDDTGRHARSRFWLGIAFVIAFVIAVVLFVSAVHGAHAGANCGLVILVTALVAVSVDGALMARRRSRRSE